MSCKVIDTILSFNIPVPDTWLNLGFNIEVMRQNQGVELGLLFLSFKLTVYGAIWKVLA